MNEPTREDIGDLLRRLVDTVVEMKDRAEALEAQLAERDKACVEWSEVSQRNYQRAKAAEAKLAKARAELVRLEYWHDTDQELIDDMTPEQRDDHIYVWDWVKCILALLDHPAPAPAPTPSPEAVAKFALGHAVGLCCPHEDDDDTARKARQECADAIAFASIVPETIAAIVAKAGGEKNDN